MSNDSLVILAQDPSFVKLSFSLYDGEGNVHLDSCPFELGNEVGFEKAFQSAREVTSLYINKLVHSYGVNSRLFINKVFSEIPPPEGIYAPGLFALDTFVLDRMFMLNKKCDEIYTLPSSYLMTIHNTRKFKKSDSTALATYLMNDVLKGVFNFHYPKKKINSDMAESLIFLMRAFCKFDIRGSKSLIIREFSGFMSDSEKLLISRKVES